MVMKRRWLLTALAGVILVTGLWSGWFYYLRPRMAANNIIQAVDIFLVAQKTDDRAQYQHALELVDRAIRWGKYDSTVGLFRGQVLAGLGRADEARAQYERVKETDPSAKQAADDLLAQLPQ